MESREVERGGCVLQLSQRQKPIWKLALSRWGEGEGDHDWDAVGDCSSQGVLFWAHGDRVWCLFLKKIEPEPLFIAGGHGHRQEMAGAEAVQAPAQAGLGVGSFPGPLPTPPQPPRKCLWDLDIPYQRMTG